MSRFISRAALAPLQAAHTLRTQAPKATLGLLPTLQPTSVSNSRGLSTSSKAGFPKKDDQDRTSINTESTEYSKSGGDSNSAQDPAFTPGVNDPKEQKRRAGQQAADGNPLEVSPANPDVSKPPPDAEKGVESSPKEGTRERASGGGSTDKRGKPE